MVLLPPLAPLNLPSLIRIQAPTEDLEALFQDGAGEAFFRAARRRAANGDSQALFLLGKAYHLGRGVTQDLAEAEALYAQAATKDHARALHNLGLLQLEVHGNRLKAAEAFHRALALGLTIPTRHNLGRVHDHTELTAMDSAQELATASDWYAQAYAETRDPESLDAAVAAAVKAVILSRAQEAPELTATRVALATRLGEQGAVLGRPRCLQNLGALHYYAGDFAAALPYVQRAAALNQPTALFTLGEMHRLGQALPKDPAAAFACYERASALGHAPATREVLSHWSELAEHQESLSVMRQAVAALVEVQARPPARDLFVDYSLEKARTRLAFLEVVHRQANAPAEVPASAPQVRIHLLDLPPDQGGVPLSHEGWWIGSCWPEGDHLQRSEVLLRGQADDEGWIRLSPKQARRLRAEWIKGRTLIFHWPGQGRVLAVRPLPQGGWELVPDQDAPY